MPDIINIMEEGDRKGRKIIKKSEIEFELHMMGFANTYGREFLADACLLYAGGMHQIQDIIAKISEDTGFGERNIYSKMATSLKIAWNNQQRSPKVMYNTKICPSLKKFIKLFVEQKMGEKS